MRRDLRDRANVLVGWREDRSDRIDGRDRAGRLVGWYDPQHDQTRDSTGRLVGYGDILSSLIATGF